MSPSDRWRREVAVSVTRCSGFTLVELLVVIAIIGLLITLLFPAVQATRESARRMRCGNNLRQLAIACQGYESSNGQFPFGRKYDIWDAYTWTQLVLPRIEQQTVYDGYWTLPQSPYSTAYPGPNGPGGNDARMRASRHAAVDTFYCPSDRSPTQNEFNTWSYGFLRGNYSGCTGSGDMYGVAVDATTGPWGPGMFRVIPRQTFDDGPDGVVAARVIDGLSNTMLLSELLVCDVPGWGGPIGETIYGNMGGALFSAAYTPNTSVADRVYGPCPQRQGDQAYTAPCTELGLTNWTPAGSGAYAAARSMHAGGVNAVMADTTVRMVSDDVSLAVWRSLGTIAGPQGAETQYQP